MLDHYNDARERYEFQMGPARGRLATALDILTDALTLVGQENSSSLDESSNSIASSSN